MTGKKKSKRKPAPGSKDAHWAEAKRLCRLSVEDVRKAKELGLNPRKLVGLNPTPSQQWKAPVKIWLRELHERTFGPERDGAPRESATGAGTANEARANRASPATDPQAPPKSREPTQRRGPTLSRGPSLSREPRELMDANRSMERRQENFRRAAEFVSDAFASVRTVRRVTLFGSVAIPLEREVSRHGGLRRFGDRVLHECKDVDLAVHLGDLGRLEELQRARSRALNELLRETGIGVAHHQVDVFILEPETDRYLGRLCWFKRCPAEKTECRVPGCGDIPLLRQHEGFVLEPSALTPASSRELFEEIPF